MPFYEYYCQDCRKKFTKRRSMKDADAAIACMECESDKTSRVLSLFAVQSGGSSAVDTMGYSGSPPAGGCCGGSCGCVH